MVGTIAWIVNGSDVDDLTTSVVVIAGRAGGLATATLFIRGVNVEMSTYGRATQSRSVIGKNKRFVAVDR
jgi:hypothetical protein